MKKLFLLLSVILLSLNAVAQLQAKEGSFKLVEGFVNINQDIQLDENDKPYSVIKVKTENLNDKQRRELLFQGDARTFIECEYKVGEVWLYISYYATYLKISHPDYSSTEFVIPFDMEPKKGYELLLVNTTKVENGTGSLTIKTKPEDGASIYLNGNKITQRTPYTNDMIAAGKYEITVSKNRYQNVTKTIVVEKDAKEVVEINMPLDVAVVTINADTETDIYIDGSFRRKGTWIGELKCGSHDIEYNKPFYQRAKRTINVTVSGNNNYKVSLTPLYGKIKINTDPVGASVYIDNHYYGKTPLALNGIMVGCHEMMIERSGFVTMKKIILLDEARELEINEKLSAGIENKSFTINGVSFDMLAVEGGTFKMGAQKSYYKGENYDTESDSDETPVHEVALSDYYMSKYVVTIGLWAALMEKNPSANYKGDKDNYPMYFTWLEAVEFCNKLSEKCGRIPYYNINVIKNNKKKNANNRNGNVETDGDTRIEVTVNMEANGFRLPTEAEWEYAAKGGSKSKGFLYSGSYSLDDVAVFWRNSFKSKSYIDDNSDYYRWYKNDIGGRKGNCEIKSVGSKKPNELGLYDMSGNAWEWCSDWYGPYNDTAQMNPTGPASGETRVIRGGASYELECEHRSSNRNYSKPDERCTLRLVLNQ